MTTLRLARVTDAPARGGDEAPAETTVLRRSYYLDETEVTNAQYGAFAKATGYRTEAEVRGSDAMLNPVGGFSELEAKVSWRVPYTFQPLSPTFQREPVIKVTWADCMQFTVWVGGTLPTVSQFVRALRGGLEGQRHPWGDSDAPPRPIENLGDAALARLGWFSRPDTTYDDGFGFIAPVRSFAPNPLGLYDLAGNVSEGCLEGASSRTDAPSGSGSKSHFILGGDWLSAPGSVGVLTYAVLDGSGGTEGVGFRCAKTLPFDAFAEDGSPQ